MEKHSYIYSFKSDNAMNVTSFLVLSLLILQTANAAPLPVRPNVEADAAVIAKKTATRSGSIEVTLASADQVQRALELAVDEVSQNLNQELKSKAGTKPTGQGFTFGKAARFVRWKNKNTIPPVLLGHNVFRHQLERTDEIAKLRQHTKPGPSSTNQAFELQIREKEAKLKRYVTFEKLHGTAKKSARSVMLTLEGEIIDLIKIPNFEDANFDIEMKLFLHWEVRNGKLQFTVDDLVGDDLWVTTGHPVAIILGFGSAGRPVDLTRNSAWVHAGLSLQNSFGDISSEVRRRLGLPADVAIKVDDIYFKEVGILKKPMKLVAKVSWSHR